MLYRIRFINVRFSFSFIYFEILEKKIAPIAFIRMYPIR